MSSPHTVFSPALDRCRRKARCPPEELLQAARKLSSAGTRSCKLNSSRASLLLPPMLEEALARQARSRATSETQPHPKLPPTGTTSQIGSPETTRPATLSTAARPRGANRIRSCLLLRQIEAHVNSLRSDLNHARTELRRQAERRPCPRAGAGIAAAPHPMNASSRSRGCRGTPPPQSAACRDGRRVKRPA